jgi:hypothetical protein
MKYFPGLAALHSKKSIVSPTSATIWRSKMTKMTFVSATLIAVTVFATQAMAARNDSAARHATTRDCVRAPNVGAFASDPYTVPPCLPNTATDALR